MEDMYTLRDEKKVVVLRGKRSGDQRRVIGPGAMLRKYGRKIMTNRRNLNERRHTTAVSFEDRMYERISSLTNGIALLAIGIFFLLTGLTFLPVVGIIVGGYIIIKSFFVMAEVLHKVE
ncbi:hypothetical protein [Desulfoluna sp.]|uniref:hypothetical protein n=1 Tax=Desulfoluna sp. TaxID=2045199 RepID=UPI0026161B59|nr:hypothetical protein [Desulfoluna sp.]